MEYNSSKRTSDCATARVPKQMMQNVSIALLIQEIIEHKVKSLFVLFISSN